MRLFSLDPAQRDLERRNEKMTCPECKAEYNSGQPFCPGCGLMLPPSSPYSPGRSVWHNGAVLFLVVVLGAGALLVYRIWAEIRVREAMVAARSRSSQPPFAYPAYSRGAVDNLGALRGQGKVYLVPIGTLQIPVSVYLEHYRSKFGLELKALAPVTLDFTLKGTRGEQYRADSLIHLILQKNRAQALEPNSVIIGITDEDIYAFDWQFTYSFRIDNRFAVVSTKRMDPKFWNGPSLQGTLPSTLQMLTKYIALLHAKLATSADPQSILAQPFTPNGGSDDLFESDLFPETTSRGRRIDHEPCLVLNYSHTQHNLSISQFPVQECDYRWGLNDSTEEAFIFSISDDVVYWYRPDFVIADTPPIEFRRALRNKDDEDRAFGRGGSHFYNSFLISSDPARIPDAEIIEEDGASCELTRLSPGSGKQENLTLRGRKEDACSGAELVFANNVFTLTSSSGEATTYQIASGGRWTYPIEYRDFDGSSLQMIRKGSELMTLKSKNHSLSFTYGHGDNISQITDDSGHTFKYGYDDRGYLNSAVDPNGGRMRYERDEKGDLLRVSSDEDMRKPPLLKAEYSSLGQLSRLQGEEVGSFNIKYLAGKPGRWDEIEIAGPDEVIIRLRRISGIEFRVWQKPHALPR